MNVLRHDDITGHHEAVTLTYALQRILEKIARLRRIQILEPVIATESYEVKTSRVFVSDESARHRWKAFNESLQMSRKSKTGLRRSVLSQVPKSEAPGAPIFSGWAHYARDLGHPPSPTKKTAAPAHSSRREHPWSILCKTACRELVIDCLHIGYYPASECR